jgi:hypothetical protein
MKNLFDISSISSIYGLNFFLLVFVFQLILFSILLMNSILLFISSWNTISTESCYFKKYLKSLMKIMTNNNLLLRYHSYQNDSKHFKILLALNLFNRKWFQKILDSIFSKNILNIIFRLSIFQVDNYILQ